MAHQGVIATLLSSFRRKAFLSAGRGRLFILPQTTLYENISREWLLFDRSKRDLNGGGVVFDEDDLLKGLTYRTAFWPNAIQEKPADTDVREAAVWWYNQLTFGFDEIRSHLSDIIAMRSYGATFLLTIVAIVIAILSFVVSIIALKGSVTAS
jgi:hypothetical protein